MSADRVYRVHIAASPEAAWQAITDPVVVRRFYFDTAVRTDWEVGHDVEYVGDDDFVHIRGELLSYDPPRSYSHRFVAFWGQEPDDQGTLTWSVEPDGDGCAVTLVHSGGSGEETAEGSQHLVDALKELLESGQSAAAIGHRYVRAVGEHDLETVRDLLDEELIAEFAGGRFGKDEWLAALDRLLPALNRNDRIRALGDGARASVDYDFVTATPAGTIRCVELVEVADGRIRGIELVLDRVAFAPVNQWLQENAA